MAFLGPTSVAVANGKDIVSVNVRAFDVRKSAAFSISFLLPCNMLQFEYPQQSQSKETAKQSGIPLPVPISAYSVVAANSFSVYEIQELASTVQVPAFILLINYYDYYGHNNLRLC